MKIKRNEKTTTKKKQRKGTERNKITNEIQSNSVFFSPAYNNYNFLAISMRPSTTLWESMEIFCTDLYHYFIDTGLWRKTEQTIYLALCFCFSRNFCTHRNHIHTRAHTCTAREKDMMKKIEQKRAKQTEWNGALSASFEWTRREYKHTKACAYIQICVYSIWHAYTCQSHTQTSHGYNVHVTVDEAQIEGRSKWATQTEWARASTK